MKTLSASVARQTLPDLLGTVQHEREPIIIERRGKPIAALVSVENLETLVGAKDVELRGKYENVESRVIDQLELRFLRFQLKDAQGRKLPKK